MTRAEAIRLIDKNMAKKCRWSIDGDAFEVAVSALMECELPVAKPETRPLHMYLGENV